MKKGYIISVLVILLVVFGCKSHFPTTQKYYNLEKGQYSLEHGKNLAYNVCGPCHYDYMNTKQFTGKEMKDLPKFMGKIYSANLTAYQGGVMSQYTDAELFYLLKTGIARDGRFIPYMIRPTMADNDINAVIVYLRSGDDPVKANDKIAGKTHLSALGKLASKIAGKPQPLETGIIAPSPSDQVAYGRYLVDIFACYHCHSKSILGLNYRNPEDSKGYMAGGYKWKIDGKKIFSPNLTFDRETGIADYSMQAFRNAVREGETPDGKGLYFPMPRFKHMTDEQADAIYAYLQSLPPVHHQVRGH